jgi:hypothetical protein
MRPLDGNEARLLEIGSGKNEARLRSDIARSATQRPLSDPSLASVGLLNEGGEQALRSRAVIS